MRRRSDGRGFGIRIKLFHFYFFFLSVLFVPELLPELEICVVGGPFVFFPIEKPSLMERPRRPRKQKRGAATRGRESNQFAGDGGGNHCGNWSEGDFSDAEEAKNQALDHRNDNSDTMVSPEQETESVRMPSRKIRRMAEKAHFNRYGSNLVLLSPGSGSSTEQSLRQAVKTVQETLSTQLSAVAKHEQDKAPPGSVAVASLLVRRLLRKQTTGFSPRSNPRLWINLAGTSGLLRGAYVSSSPIPTSTSSLVQ